MMAASERSLLPGLKRRYVQWASARLDRELCGADGFWLFILGVNNSGTTILSKILETHPEIRGLPREGHQLTTAFPRPDLLGVGRLWSSRMEVFRWTEGDDPRPALVAKQDWRGLYRGTGRILLEKSPPNTVRGLWLQRNFSPSRFLAIVRHPYAVCEGIRRRKGYTIEQAARHWVVANDCLLKDLQGIEQALLLRYEDMVARPVDTLGGVSRFLGLRVPIDPLESANLAAHSIQGTTTGLKDLNTESFRHLSRDDSARVDRICGELMRHFDYESR